MNEIDHPAISKFFNIIVPEYILPDLSTLRIDVRPDDLIYQSGCTVATAMMCFSIIDLIGYLINPDINTKKRNTSENMEYAFSKSAGLFPAEYAKYSEILIKIFRHGIMHQIFPKASGISKPHPPNDSLIFYITGDKPHLNVDVLTDDIIEILVDFYVILENNNELATRMEERLSILQKDDAEQLSEFRNVLDSESDKIKITYTTTTTTTA